MRTTSFVLFEYEYEALIASLRRDHVLLSEKTILDSANQATHQANARMVSRLLETFVPQGTDSPNHGSFKVEVSDLCSEDLPGRQKSFNRQSHLHKTGS